MGSTFSWAGTYPTEIPGIPDGAQVLTDRDEVVAFLKSLVSETGCEFDLSVACVLQVFEEFPMKLMVACRAPIDLSHWRHDKMENIVVFVPMEDVCTTIPLPAGIGVFYASGRPWFSYHSFTHKLALKSWLEAKTGECIVCYDSPADTAADGLKTTLMSCTDCVALMCPYCILHFATQPTAKKIDNEMVSFPCPNCRGQFEAHFPLAAFNACFRIWNGEERSLRLDAEIKRITCKTSSEWIQRTRHCLQSTHPIMDCLMQPKNGCHKCGKTFSDNAQYKHATKCANCCVAAYCSTQCREEHAKLHQYLCEPKKAKGKKKKKKKRKADGRRRRRY